MIREAELFVMGEQVLVEVLGRIGPADGRTVLPPLFAGDPPVPMREALARQARADAEVAAVLAGRPSGADLPEGNLQAVVPRLAEAACAAARTVDEADEDTRAYLLKEAIARAFVAHDVAMRLGSRACPLTEEQARGLWEATEPDAATWRERGVFGEPLTPVPADVSWRDRFLMSAGRDPHALEH